MKVGVIGEQGAEVFTWSATKKAIEHSGHDVVYFLEMPANKPKRALKVFPARALWRVIRKIENYLAGYTIEYFPNADAIPLACTFKGHFKEFDQTDLSVIRDQNVDVLIRLGGRGIYRGGILSEAKHGIISIHHGDNRKFRGGPPGFWELIMGDSSSGFIIQRLTNILDGGDVLARGEVKVSAYAAKTRMNLYKAADHELAKVVSDLLDRNALSEIEIKDGKFGPIYLMPRVTDLVRYLTTILVGSARHKNA